MTTIEAIETVLVLAKAERDNSQEGNSAEALSHMDDAIETVERWLQGIKAGGLT